MTILSYTLTIKIKIYDYAELLAIFICSGDFESSILKSPNKGRRGPIKRKRARVCALVISLRFSSISLVSSLTFKLVFLVCLFSSACRFSTLTLTGRCARPGTLYWMCTQFQAPTLEGPWMGSISVTQSLTLRLRQWRDSSRRNKLAFKGGSAINRITEIIAIRKLKKLCNSTQICHALSGIEAANATYTLTTNEIAEEGNICLGEYKDSTVYWYTVREVVKKYL